VPHGPVARQVLVHQLALEPRRRLDPAAINRIESEFAKVTPELILKTAQEYLRSTNRTVLTVEPRKLTP